MIVYLALPSGDANLEWEHQWVEALGASSIASPNLMARTVDGLHD